MKETLHIIALRTVNYSDRHAILSAFSLERGPVSFLLPAGSGREASRRRALLMPLSLVECSADLRPGRDIYPMSSPRLLASMHSLRTSPIKGTIIMFLTEALGILLREMQPDAGVWHFIERSIAMLDALPDRLTANFHICFLVRLGAMLGIEPDVSGYSSGRVFDMIDGRFRSSAPAHTDFLSGPDAEAAARIVRISYANMHRFALTRSERSRLLDAILHYYTLHYATLERLHSTDILRTLF
ncbi:MAG: DNA repair protein RecO [Muribaculaceae bacterium]|nr:DNA repair protein RecO [Muribaculaceae bacterium]